LLPVGCAEFTLHGNDNPPPAPPAPSDFDALLEFGANLADISPASRAKMCRLLLKSQTETSEAGIQLRLMVGRLLSDACGDITKILDGVNAIPSGSLADERMRRFVALHTETLKRLQSVSRKAGSRERKQKEVQSVPESKELKEPRKDETRLLREKLEAIRSMEKHLDESGDGN
jgi:hypothetical protein